MPIRGDIHVAVDYKTTEPENMTLREIVEYYKHVVHVAQALGTATSLELKHIQQAWDYLVGLVATREGVPSGFLTYLLSELARSEMRALELAEDANGTLEA
jgi:hypothetical protein